MLINNVSYLYMKQGEYTVWQVAITIMCTVNQIMFQSCDVASIGDFLDLSQKTKDSKNYDPIFPTLPEPVCLPFLFIKTKDIILRHENIDFYFTNKEIHRFIVIL